MPDDPIRALALETYRKAMIGRPHMPDPGTPEGQRKIDRLEDIMRRHVEAAAATQRQEGASDAGDTKRLDWLEKHPNIEVSFDPWDGEAVWRAHKVTGGRNDREWSQISEAETLRGCIDAAMEATPIKKAAARRQGGNNAE